MELHFQSKPLRCLKLAAADTKTQEQTLEIRIPDNMPPVGKVLGAWGQPLIRSKEWRSDHVIIHGGVMVWVLYDGEGNAGQASVEGWMPFQMRWDLRDSERDGTIGVDCMLQGVDARLTGAGKVMVRAVVSAVAEAWEPSESMLYAQPEDLPKDVQVHTKRCSVCLPVEAGEKTLTLEEDVILPPGNVDVERVLHYSFQPVIRERKLLSDKLVFRGGGKLHVLYLGTDGMMHAFDTELPISQYCQLETDYDPDSPMWIWPAVTELELEKKEDGRLGLKAGLLGQYVVCDSPEIQVVQDAYSPHRIVELQMQTAGLPLVGQERPDTLTVYQTVEGQIGRLVENTGFAGHASIRPGETGMQIEAEGATQILYYDSDGKAQCVLTPWEQKWELPEVDSVRVCTAIRELHTPEVTPDGEEMTVRTEMELGLRGMQTEGISMVAGLSLGEETEPDPARPSLILRRKGEQSLWETAKKCGSTVQAIREANALTEEPEPDRMLLIPVV